MVEWVVCGKENKNLSSLLGAYNKKHKEIMCIINGFLRCPFSSETVHGSQEKRANDPENSTLLKTAACIPVLGILICTMQSASLEKKIKKLSLPKDLRPHPILGNILDENATSVEKKAACLRAVQLKSINRDYTKAALVNNILTIALVVYALAINVIPLVVAGILIGAFSLAAALFTFALYSDRSIKRYEKFGAAYT
jgi:hypothetical protein